MSLVELAKRICANADDGAKPLRMYAIYDRYFGEFSGPINLLELGVHTGESLKLWASYFPQGKIIGIDIIESPNFSDYPNVVFECADQTDSDRLKEICLTHGELDIVIDDASHIGQYSAASYDALFPHLKRGGLYIIEDWCTGYLGDWPDGSEFQRCEAVDGRIPSHDFGMVGFIKTRVDEVACEKRKPTLRSTLTLPNIFSF